MVGAVLRLLRLPQTRSGDKTRIPGVGGPLTITRPHLQSSSASPFLGDLDEPFPMSEAQFPHRRIGASTVTPGSQH